MAEAARLRPIDNARCVRHGRCMKRRKMTPADIVIFTGIAVNVIVIGLIVYYFVL
jgi:ASC-1-like (ASCH) protein